eukprot:2136178-Pleurochrysis_carterae.AAC.3
MMCTRIQYREQSDHATGVLYLGMITQCLGTDIWGIESGACAGSDVCWRHARLEMRAAGGSEF